MKIERQFRRWTRSGEDGCLAFDMAADPDLAPLALEFLEAIRLQATFLVGAAQPQNQPETLLRILCHGHEVVAREGREPASGAWDGNARPALNKGAGLWPRGGAAQGPRRLGFLCVRRQVIVFWSSAGPEGGTERRQVGRIEVEAVAAGRVTLLREGRRAALTRATLERIIKKLMQCGIRPLNIGEALARGRKE